MAARADTSERVEEIEAAAIVGFAGLDADAFLRLDEPLEQAVTLAVANRIVELKIDEREDLARRIRHEIAEMLNG